ncbi:MAG: hypothetical protein ACAH95_07140 [Fimbriimonas sp.]
MSTSQLKPRGEDAISLIEREIARAEFDCRPISRQMLAETVHTETGLTTSDALALVEQYCEEKAPAVPGYLQEEFAVPYLKVIAILNVAVGVTIFWFGVNAFRSKAAVWPYLCVGTIFCGLGAFAWVVSLERYAERRAKRNA